MKKVIIFLSIVIGLFVLIAIITTLQEKQATKGNIYNKSNLKPSTIDLLDDPNYQNIILPNELEEKLDNEEDVVVYFFSPECHFCKQTTPIINPVAKDMDINLLQYNLLEFNEGYRNYNIESTPTVIYFEDGKEKDRTIGLQTADDFKQFFSGL